MTYKLLQIAVNS